VHDLEPDAKTILTVSTTLLPTFGNYIQRVSQQVNYDMVGMFDYPAYKLNTSQDSLDSGLCGRVATVKQTSGGKPAIIMESGFETSDLQNEAQTQADYVTAITKSALHAGVGGVFFYEYLDNPQEVLPREQHFGLLQADRTPKPAWTDYGNLIKQYQ
jgi:exo-beta-1,3-glucanase (GH17 family)